MKRSAALTRGRYAKARPSATTFSVITSPPPVPGNWAPEQTGDQQLAVANSDFLFTLGGTGGQDDGSVRQTLVPSSLAAMADGDPIGTWLSHQNPQAGMVARADLTGRPTWDATEGAIKFLYGGSGLGQALFLPDQFQGEWHFWACIKAIPADPVRYQVPVSFHRWRIETTTEALATGYHLRRLPAERDAFPSNSLTGYRLVEAKRDSSGTMYVRTNGASWVNVGIKDLINSPNETGGDFSATMIGRTAFTTGAFPSGIAADFFITGFAYRGDTPLADDSAACQAIRRIVCRGRGLSGLDPVVDPDSPPVVTTQGATNVGTTGATLNGTLTSVGDQGTPDRFFEWRLGSSGSWNATTKVAQSSTGAFSQAISGLLEASLHQARAAAETGIGTVYGAVVEFTTGTTAPPGTEPGAGPATQTVTSKAALESAYAAAPANAVIQVQNGTSLSGTFAMNRNDITVRAQSIGGVTWAAGSVITMSGQRNVLRGFLWQGGSSTQSGNVQLGGTDNQVWRCRFNTFGGKSVRYISGSGGRTMYCEFSSTNAADPWQPNTECVTNDGGSVAHTGPEIGYCYFHDLPSKPEGEPYGTRSRTALLFGRGSGQGRWNSNGFIHHNLFVNCGNCRLSINSASNLIEYCTITGKTGGNVTRSTDFGNRFGVNNIWRGCWSEQAEGYFMTDGGGNKMISCVSTNSGGTIAICRGTSSDINTVGNGVVRAINWKLTACDGPVSVGFGYSAYTVPAENTTIENHLGGGVSLVSGGQINTVQTGTMTETPITPIKITTAMVGPNGTG
jgi:hypothetical protein